MDGELAPRSIDNKTLSCRWMLHNHQGSAVVFLLFFFSLSELISYRLSVQVRAIHLDPSMQAMCLSGSLFGGVALGRCDGLPAYGPPDMDMDSISWKYIVVRKKYRCGVRGK